MSLSPIQLKQAVEAHAGTFRCSRLHHPSESKTVAFRHETTPPGHEGDLPHVGRLADFYGAFGSVTFYVDPNSGDAARHIAPPAAWPALHEHFAGWMVGLDESEREDFVPPWIDSCLVIGEEPHTGNYILMPTTGDQAGAVFHFEHDGFEFVRQADDLVQYAQKLLDPDDAALVYMATHMRFVEGADYAVQWWIEEMQDNRGNVARTSC